MGHAHGLGVDQGEDALLPHDVLSFGTSKGKQDQVLLSPWYIAARATGSNGKVNAAAAAAAAGVAAAVLFGFQFRFRR